MPSQMHPLRMECAAHEIIVQIEHTRATRVRPIAESPQSSEYGESEEITSPCGERDRIVLGEATDAIAADGCGWMRMDAIDAAIAAVV